MDFIQSLFPFQKVTNLGFRPVKWMSNLLKTYTASAVVSASGALDLRGLKIFWFNRSVFPGGTMNTE